MPLQDYAKMIGKFDPIAIDQQIAETRGAQQRNRLADFAFAENERATQFQDKRRNALMSAMNPNTGEVDDESYTKGLAGIGDYEGLQTFRKDQADRVKSKREADRAQLDANLKNFEVAAQIMGPVKDQATWDMARQQTAEMFGQEAAAQMPAQYDPVLIDQKRKQAMPIKDQLEQEWKKKGYDLDVDKFGETKRSNKVTEGISRGNLGVAQAGLGLRKEELDIKRKESAAGKAPAGYRYMPDGSLEAIPGGPADIKAGELGAKRERQQQGAIDQADRIIKKVDQSIEKIGYTTAGFGGSTLSAVPGTDARNLKSDLETIKANLGFAELQAMRDASPTGGALGQVAVQELVALQSTVASLDQAQGQDQLKERLGEVKKHYENWKKAVNESRGVTNKSGNNAEPKRVASDADYNALPSGSEFIDPNGKRRRKP